MSITIKYFASLREQQGVATRQLPATGIASINDIIHQHDDPALPESTLVAINQVYANAEQAVVDGDEVAFFPPVTGG